MKTIKINNPDKTGKLSVIDRIAGFIAEGKTVILPTGTIYGISCKYDDRNAIERIYKIKKRNKSMPFIIMISRTDDLKFFTIDINPAAENLIKKFWNKKDPEPLTLVFNKRKNLKKFITGGRPTIAVRMAELKFLRDIIDICGPIISTSATISGIKISPGKIEDIPVTIRRQVDLIVECNFSLPGIESTIISVTDNTPVLVREGKVKFKEVLEAG